MKRLLSIIGAISLVGTSTTSLVACNKTHEYTPEELAKLKEENKINTKDQTVRDNLEWIAPQEKPFNEVDNKWYYVVWKKNDKWEIIKTLRNYNIEVGKEYSIYKDDNYELKFFKYPNKDASLFYYSKSPSVFREWKKTNSNYFKSVYRWNLDTKEPDLIIDNNGNIKVNGE
ncbi:lipoprotein [Spiroplasma endosymbiont of Glossina fuscipes fuscipes]|uniref:lipoprotein n=1 Tax=Spiroplasma endosymbiont of Glossina fuscipes fuscipes TaxID=2004463 RepID=UPI003C72222C